MNMLEELAELHLAKQQVLKELDEVKQRIKTHPTKVRQELDETKDKLERNLAGTLVRSTTTKKKRSTRAPHGLRKWQLYSVVIDVADRGKTRDSKDNYTFNLDDIWSAALKQYDGKKVDDYESFQGSARTMFSSDDFFKSLEERGKYAVTDYPALVKALAELAENESTFQDYLNQVKDNA